MTRIKNLFVAGLAALGLTLTPVPAAADGEDIAKALAGLAILGLIAKSIDDRNDRKKANAAEVSRLNTFDDRRGTRIIGGELRRPGEAHRRSNRPAKYKRHALPDRCLRLLETDRRDRLVYTRHCLNRNYRHANRLPDHCERKVRTDRGLRTVYGARCLARDGWQVARR